MNKLRHTLGRLFKKKREHAKEDHATHAEKAPGRAVPFAHLQKELKEAFSGGFSLKAQTTFTKRLAFLMDAGVPIMEALHMLRDQAEGATERKILGQIVHDTSHGQSLSKSFAKFPKFFNDFSVQIIKVGENSGTLSQNLVYLSDELRKRQALRSKVIGAFIYPSILILATLGITVFLMVYLFPKIMPIFASLHAELPLPTKIVIAISTFLQHFGLLLFALIVILYFVIVFVFKKNEQLRYLRDRFLVHVPVMGTVVQYYNVANSTRTLGLLLKSGMRLSDALPVTADTTGNLAYKELFMKLSDAVLRGERISAHLLKEKHYFPAILSNLVAVGERSGTLSETLVYISEMYDTEVDEFTKSFSTLVEPVLMVVMGIVVGFIAISIISPIYGITQNLHG